MTIDFPIAIGLTPIKTAPFRYLSHIINSQAKNTLNWNLKKLDLAMIAYSGGIEQYKGFAFFEIIVQLTDKGLEKYQLVVDLIFKYLDLIEHKGIENEELYEEMQSLYKTNKLLQEKDEKFAVNLAQVMQRIPIHDVLLPEFDYDDPKVFLRRLFISELKRDNCNIFLGSNTFNNLSSVEYWTGTEYEFTQLENTIQKDQEYEDVFFELPALNPFVPDKNFEIIGTEDKHPKTHPREIVKGFWYKLDNVFLVPQTFMWISLAYPPGIKAVYSYELQLFFELVYVNLLDTIKYARDAGINTSIEITMSSICIGLFGFSDKIGLVLEKILALIASSKSNLDTSEFETIKIKNLIELRNKSRKEPFRQAMEILRELNDGYNYVPLRQELSILKGITKNDIASLEGISDLSPTMLVMGNVAEKEALRIREQRRVSF